MTISSNRLYTLIGSSGDSNTTGNQFLAVACGSQLQILTPSSTDDFQLCFQPSADVAHQRPIIQMTISECGGFVVTTCEAKLLKIWQRDPENQSWSLFLSKEVPKKVNAMLFTKDATHLLFVDKFGDTYRIALSAQDTSLELIGGHVSMAMDIVMHPSEKYIITCDRDEKIRITNYPVSHVIHSFYFGHKQFVNCIHIPRFDPSCLISGGGDPDVFIWSIPNSPRPQQRIPLFDEIKKMDEFADFTEENMAVRQIVSGNGWVAVSVDQVPIVFFMEKNQDGEWALAKQIHLNDCPVSMTVDGQDRLLVSLATQEGEGRGIVSVSYNCSEKTIVQLTLPQLEAEELSESSAPVFALSDLRKSPADINQHPKRRKMEKDV